MGILSKKQQSVPRRRMEQSGDSQPRPTASDLDARYSFRRNRTLTGSLSSDVSSAVEHRSELKSARVHTHHLRRHRRHALGWLFTVLLISAALATLLFQSIVHVSVISSAQRLSDATLYEQSIQEYLQKHPFERFRFALNLGSLAAYLQAHDMPEVESADSIESASGLGNAQVALTFRKPAVVWQTAGVNMYVDAKGNSFQRNYYAEPSVQVVDQTGIQSQNNQVLASNRFLSFIGKVVGRMQENGYKVAQIILPADTTRQVQVKLDGVAYLIKLSVDRAVGEQAEDAARAVVYLQQKGIGAEYIDVRVSGRAYYK